MNTKPLVLLLITTIGIFSTLAGCGKEPPNETAHVGEAALAKYISGYTSTTISSRGEVVVRLTSDVETAKQSGQRLFNFEPSVSGSEIWLDDHTVAFRPTESFRQGTRYNASFKLASLTQTPENLNTFSFNFETIKQDLEVDVQAVVPSSEDRRQQTIIGEVHTADVASIQQLQNVLQAEQNGNALPIAWTQEPGQRVHHFEITEVQRTQSPGEVQITWNGQPLDIGNRGQETVNIPSLNQFELVDTRVIREENPHIVLSFSDLLNPSQNLDGLIRLDEDDQLNFIIQENRIEVYPRSDVKGMRTLYISPGIQNRDGKPLEQEISRSVQLFQLKPQLRFAGKGSILPSSEELLLPFEAASVGAVDVQVSRIFRNNILQFLQDYSLGGDAYSLNQVGRPIYQQVVPLASLGTVDPGTWNSYALDLSKLIEPEPGAIYQVEMGFRKHQTIYPCGDNSNMKLAADGSIERWTLDARAEEEYWNRFDDFYYPENFDWQERENPCQDSYYMGERHISRSVLASNLGIIAKQGETGPVNVLVTDLNTTEPKTDVSLTLYDFQQQELATATTDGRGRAEMETERDPSFLVARDGKQYGYLKLDDGSSLSLSDFDVSGAEVKEGIKGFLYGERGVWRPGDSLFVTLIVDDQANTLPPDHPVTFELHNPSGQVYDRQVLSHPLNGFYSYRTKTGRDSPTGTWTVSAQLGGNTFSKSVRIEMVKPNRLKVNVDLEDERLTASDHTLNGTISSQWLHGATAGNLETDISMTLLRAPISFDQYPDFTFSDPSWELNTSTEEIFKGTLNAQGEVPFSYTLNEWEDAPGKLRASLLTRVFEPSGNFSVNRSGIDYYPYPVMVGLKLPESEYDWQVLPADSTNIVDIITVNTEGKAVPNRPLDVRIFKIDWRWWWEKSGQNLSQFNSSQNVTPVLQQTISTSSDGLGKISFNLEDKEWGRYLIKVEDPRGGYSAGQTFYLGWGRGGGQTGNPARLTFRTDKDQYSVGDEIRITFPSSAGGKALVSLETGSSILQQQWLETSPEQTEVTFLASADMSPNVYAHIMFIQPHGQQQNDRPIRMYGVIPIEVEDPATRLSPTIAMPDELRPETSATVDVSEADGSAMTYTLAMVDEGLLDLTNYPTPAPHSHFYAREALGVKTWDMFDNVAGAYAGSMNRILSIGGDAAMEELEPKEEVTRFEPMVRFKGPFHLEAGQINRHTVDIPNYVGSVRTMVIAGNEGAYGSAQETTPVRKPVMVLGTLPRVLGPAEEVSLPVSVFAMQEGVNEITVDISTNDIFTIEGPAQRTIPFDEPGSKIVRFQLEVASRVGAGRVQINASGGGEVAHHEIDIEVRNPNPPVTDVYKQVLDPGESWNFEFDPVGLGGTNTGTFEISSIPPINLAQRLGYLTRYPHGSIEQVTSSVFPQLYLDRFMDLSDARSEEIEKNIEAAIKRMRSFQVPSGALGYWPDYNTGSEWGTTYAYHFLLEANEQGYHVPSDLLSNINRFQRNRARSWRFTEERSSRDDLIQAYRLYTLALAQTPELGAMNRLRESSQLSVPAVWRLAAAYVLAGQPEAARELAQGTDTSVPEYQELGHTYGSSTRDKAMILEALSLMGRREQAAVLMKEIARQLQSDRWMSTQTTAYSLIGISEFLQIAQLADKVEVDYDITSAGEGSISSTAPLSQVPLNITNENKQQVSVTNNSDGVVFARILQQGTPLIGDQTAASNNLTQDVRYITRDGDAVDPANLPQGTDIIAEVTVKNPGIRGDYEELVLTQVFPSGWEITNSRMDDITFREPTSASEYQDIRDDRVYTYFDLAAGQSKTFRVLVNASYTGRFYLPTVSTSAMYDESINTRTPGQWVEVSLQE